MTRRGYEIALGLAYLALYPLVGAALFCVAWCML